MRHHLLLLLLTGNELLHLVFKAFLCGSEVSLLVDLSRRRLLHVILSLDSLFRRGWLQLLWHHH